MRDQGGGVHMSQSGRPGVTPSTIGSRCPSSNLTLAQVHWTSVLREAAFLGLQAEASKFRATSVTVHDALSLLLRALSRARSSGAFLPRVPDVWT